MGHLPAPLFVWIFLEYSWPTTSNADPSRAITESGSQGYATTISAPTTRSIISGRLLSASVATGVWWLYYEMKALTLH